MKPEPLYYFRLDGKIMPARTLEDFCLSLWFTPAENRRMEACQKGTTEWVPLTSLFHPAGMRYVSPGDHTASSRALPF